MSHIKGIGGIFFKSQNPEALSAWYKQHLGIDASTPTGAIFPWREDAAPDRTQMTIWSAFSEDTDYFSTSRASFMINYIVDDLAAVLAELRAAGIAVDDHTEDHEYGRFGWATDLEGNRFELWEPKS